MTDQGGGAVPDPIHASDGSEEGDSGNKVTKSDESVEDLKKGTAADLAGDDEHDEDGFISPPMREFRVTSGIFSKQALAFNPLSSIIGIGCLWGIAIWCMVDPKGSKESLLESRAQIALDFTWLIIVSKPIAFFFLVYVTFRFGHVRLGRPHELPQYTGTEYFTMLFAAGVAVGIFYFGVSEPLWHRASHYFVEAGYHSQDEIDQFAMHMTIYHWGLHAWAVYLTVAVSASLASYRFSLPLTFRSAFYPILGEYTWGWFGDVIDGFSIVVTVAGVCTSLGLGAIQMASGLQRIGWVDDDLTADEKVNVQTAIIWVVTAVATISVITGLDVGVKYLSMFAFSLGMILTFAIFAMDQWSYILNLMIQTFGYYFQYGIFQQGFHADAFAQLTPGLGRAIDSQAAATWWMDAWTIFYWNWWTSWACFVGLFVARISRGRTVAELVVYSMFVPLIYCILWFGVWGGIGLRQARQAEELEQLGLDLFNNSAYFRQEGSDFCYDVPQDNFVFNGSVVFENLLPGVTPVCQFDSGNQDSAAFNVLYSFSYPEDFSSGFGPFLSVVFLFSVAVYFATSSDSGSMVVDFLASNGRIHHHWIQRLFWALTEGAVATALLNAGGSDGLAALQAASIICGLPFTVFLLFQLQSIYEMLVQADANPEYVLYQLSDRQFRVPSYGGIFNIFEFLASFGSVHPTRKALGIDFPESNHVVEFFKGLFVPMFSLYQIRNKLYPNSTIGNLIYTGIYAAIHILWIVLFALTAEYEGLMAWGWTAYFINVTLVTGLKMGIRQKFGIHGNLIGDFISAGIMWPQVMAQLNIELDSIEPEEIVSADAEMDA